MMRIGRPKQKGSQSAKVAVERLKTQTRNGTFSQPKEPAQVHTKEPKKKKGFFGIFSKETSIEEMSIFEDVASADNLGDLSDNSSTSEFSSLLDDYFAEEPVEEQVEEQVEEPEEQGEEFITAPIKEPVEEPVTLVGEPVDSIEESLNSMEEFDFDFDLIEDSVEKNELDDTEYVIEEPAIEEPEPVAEEPVIEEPVAEEPVIEELEPADDNLVPEESAVQTDDGMVSEPEEIEHNDSVEYYTGELPFTRVENDDNVYTDSEYEQLLDLFSTLTPIEVEALPEGYKKLFYQNFKVNESYVSEEDNSTITDKLGIKDLDLLEDLELKEVVKESATVSIAGIELDTSIAHKLLTDDEFNSLDDELVLIQEKLDNVCEEEEAVPTLLQEDEDEAIIIVNYQNDCVPDAEFISEGVIGLLPYKVFVNGKLARCNKNFEVLIGRGEHVLIRTGISFVTTTRHSVEIVRPDSLKQLDLVNYRVNDSSVDLEYVATDDTYLGKGSIVCELHVK